MVNSEHLADKAGSRLANKLSVLSHAEQGLQVRPNGVVIFRTQQPANDLSNLVPVNSVSNTSFVQYQFTAHLLLAHV